MAETTRAEQFRIEALRRMSPGRKLRVIFDMWEYGFALRVAGVKLRFPEFNDDEARLRAVAEMVECHKKNSSRKSPLS